MADDPFSAGSASHEREAFAPRPRDELAHDLNNALTAVIGSLEPLERMLSHAALGDAAAKRAHLYAQSALHGAELATVLARELRGEPRAGAQALDLDSKLDAAIAIVSSSAPKGTSIVSLARPGVRVWALGSDLVSVFVNVLKNAVEATDPARVNYVVVRTQSRAQDIDVVISDTGGGMSPELRARVLAGSYSTKDGAARGLGLRIVTRILDQVGGAFAIDSDVGAGTVVRVTLPLAEPEEDVW